MDIKQSIYVLLLLLLLLQRVILPALGVQVFVPQIVRPVIYHLYVRCATAGTTCLQAAANPVLRTRRVTDQRLCVIQDIKRAAIPALKTERSIPVRRA